MSEEKKVTSTDAEGADKKTKSSIDASVINDSLGRMLMLARKERKEKLSVIAENLCIKESYLRALEMENYDVLPEPVYTIGFIKLYAKHLGVDADRCVYLYKNRARDKKSIADLVLPSTVEVSAIPKQKIIILSLGGFFVLYLLILLWTEKDTIFNKVYNLFSSPDVVVETTIPEPEEAIIKPLDIPATSPKSEVKKKEPKVAAPAPKVIKKPVVAPLPTPSTPRPEKIKDVLLKTLSPKPIKDTAITAPAKPQKVFLKTIHATWIEIRNKDREVVVKRFIFPGEKFEVPQQKGLRLAVGDSGSLRAEVGKTTISDFGPRYRIRRDIALDAEKLLAR